MKFTLTFKDPDYDTEDMADVLYDKTGIDFYDFIHEWVDGEYITLQFDTDAKTCTVVKSGENGINEHWDRPDVVAAVKPVDTETPELKRQLDEALETLSKEEDKSTPYAQSLLRFIMDTREQIKFYETDETAF
jgi:hypothetical protein